MGPLIVGAHRGAGKFRSLQLGKCEWPYGTRRLPTAGGDAGVNEGARGAWRTPR